MQSNQLIIRQALHCAEGLVSVLLLGEKGTGKTFFAKQLAKDWNAKLLRYTVTAETGMAQLLYDLHPLALADRVAGKTTDSQAGIVKGVLWEAAETSRKEKVVVLIDELDKGRDGLQNSFLDVLDSASTYDPFTGKISFNPQNIIFVFASNEEKELNDPFLRRNRRIRLQYPTLELQTEIIEGKLGKEKTKELGIEKIKFLIRLAEWIRTKDVQYKPITDDLYHIANDLCLLEEKEKHLIPSILLQWLSPYQEDWKVLNEFPSGGIKYITGMLAN